VIVENIYTDGMIVYKRKENYMTAKLVTFKMDEMVRTEFDQFCSDVG